MNINLKEKKRRKRKETFNFCRFLKVDYLFFVCRAMPYILFECENLRSLSINIPFMVRRGSVGSASACCKAGPSSILGSAPQGSFPH
jgi:hypothetical protein